MRIEKRITIRKPIEDVFAFLTDMKNVPRWTPVKNTRQVMPGPQRINVGEKFIQVIEVMGRQFEVMTEITNYQPPTIFGFKAVSGPFPLQCYFMFTPVEDSTHVTFIGEGEMGNALTFAGPLIISIAGKQLDNHLFLLKSILEAQK